MLPKKKLPTIVEGSIDSRDDTRMVSAALTVTSASCDGGLHSIDNSLSTRDHVPGNPTTKSSFFNFNALNANARGSSRPRGRQLGINFLDPRRQTNPPSCSVDEDEVIKHSPKCERRPSSILQIIVDDFTPRKGDQKIIRAVGRTVAVNAAVFVAAAAGGAAVLTGAVGFAAGGAITTKRLVDGVVAKDEKEVTKSLAVYGCATGASVAGQVLTGALMMGLFGASLPLAGAVAFGAGCCCGITAGALSEWTVDGVMDMIAGKNVGMILLDSAMVLAAGNNGRMLLGNGRRHDSRPLGS